jgi:aminopeptidase-like protein
MEYSIDNSSDVGNKIYSFACDIFPICRSITGDGIRETLKIIKQIIPNMTINEVPSGTRCFDWTVPKEWNIRDAFIMDENGVKVVDFMENNLHVVGYSVPVDISMPLSRLKKNLHSIPNQPDAIPYITSYYEENWGFCLTQDQLLSLKEGEYHVVIESTLESGSLSYGELVIPGEIEEEVFISTYVCHPSMANNEISGPAVTTFLCKWLEECKDRRYTYRIIFIPETIGSITYLSRHLEHLKKHVIAGFNVTCVGDDRTYSYLPSRQGNTLSDRVALHTLRHIYPNFEHYSYLDRGSDERQYCSPGVDLPVATITRSKYHEYPEYHTSKDDLSLISPAGLFGAYHALKNCFLSIEKNEKLSMIMPCEPQLGRRNLYPKLSKGGQNEAVQNLMGLIGYCDGQRDLLEIAEILGVSMLELLEPINELKRQGVLISEA